LADCSRARPCASIRAHAQSHGTVPAGQWFDLPRSRRLPEHERGGPHDCILVKLDSAKTAPGPPRQLDEGGEEEEEEEEEEEGAI
jgi:hypothetical protein